MPFGEILGLVAGAITTGSFVPQVVKVYQIRSAREISLVFTLLFILGDLLWLGYGIYIQQIPIIVWNILGAVLALGLLVGKLRYGQVKTVARD